MVGADETRDVRDYQLDGIENLGALIPGSGYAVSKGDYIARRRARSKHPPGRSGSWRRRSKIKPCIASNAVSLYSPWKKCSGSTHS